MLFDLRGRRRRAVQVTYLFLAVLMGGGLVLFGIGGDVSGGLVDAFKGGGGDDSADQAVQDRIDSLEERLAQNPQNAAVLAALTRENYQLATTQIPSGTSAFPEEAQDDLRQAASYYTRYTEVVEEPDTSLASLAVQLYGPEALNQPGDATQAALILARQANSTESYLNVVLLATQAGDKRTADLAAQKAIDLAPKDQRKQIEQQIEAFKKSQEQQAPQG